MVKVSSKYAATGGWGFGHFADGKSPALKIERRKRISQAAHVATESTDLSAELKRGIGSKKTHGLVPGKVTTEEVRSSV